MITPEIIDQIHELILEDRRISAKSIAENLGISREVGPEVDEKTSSEQLSAGRDQIDYLSRLVTMDETWLYHYDREIK